MNKFLSIASGCALALTLVPPTASANTTQTALDACASALVADLSAEQGASMSYSLGDSLKSPGRRLNKGELFHLDVLEPKSQRVVARADCWVDSRARVQRIESVPIEAGDAEVRAVTAR